MNENLLQVKENEEILTTSIIVAEKFSKRHDHVIRDIERLVTQLNSVPTSGDTFKFTRELIQNTQNKQFYPMYYMNENAFYLLAMGFNNTRDVLDWKLKFINAFKEMKRRLYSESANIRDNRLELVKLMSKAKDFKVADVKELYPEYFRATTEIGSLEYVSELNTSYLKWKEDYNISKEWLGDFPTIDIYNHYARYCIENRLNSMGKKTFYHTLEVDFNLTRRQKSNGYRYFLSA